MNFPPLEHPIVQAPLAGGPSTVELAVAVSEAGGLGILAAGYLSAEILPLPDSDAAARQTIDSFRRMCS